MAAGARRRSRSRSAPRRLSSRSDPHEEFGGQRKKKFRGAAGSSRMCWSDGFDFPFSFIARDRWM
uniref:Uncharacterized protein n=1 Tax=Arundo donax TaxID=35708 RepID=A0A0A9EX03_ARUDO